MIVVDLDLSRLSRALRYMSEKQRAFVITDALNRSMDGMFTTAKRAIPRQANVEQRLVTSALTKIPATRGGLVAMVRARERWLPGGYSRFRARQGGGGTSFTPWQQRQFIKGGFIATMGSGHYSIFVRGKKNVKRVGPNRKWLPIIDVGWGPNVANEMVRLDQPAAQAIITIATTRFQARFASNFERVTGQAKARFGL